MAIPMFDSLLPTSHNSILMDLLFALATWHAYAKLRLHTDSTLALFETATSILGEQLHRFVEVTCAAYKTTETPPEVTACARHNAKQASNSGSGAGAQQNHLTLSTYK